MTEPKNIHVMEPNDESTQRHAFLQQQIDTLSASLRALVERQTINSEILRNVAQAVCGDTSSAMKEESLIQIQRRHEKELAEMRKSILELEPLKRLYWGMTTLMVVLNAPVCLWALNQWARSK